MAFDPEYEVNKQNQTIQDVLSRSRQFNQSQSSKPNTSELPFLQDSPYVTDPTQFDPYEPWRSTYKDSDSSSVNDPSYDTTTIPGIPQNFSTSPVDEAPVDDRQSISLGDAEEQKWLDEWHPFDPEWRKAKDKWTPAQDAQQEMAENQGFGSWEEYQKAKGLKDQEYKDAHTSSAEYHQYDPETFESTDPEVIAQQESEMWGDIDADVANMDSQDLIERYGTDDPNEIRNLIDPEVIEQRTQEALAAGYESLEEYEQAMGQWKPFDPQWRRAKGKGTPIQDRQDQREEDAMWEDIDADNQTKSDTELMDKYGTTDPDEIKKAMHKEMYGELGEYQYVDEGGNLQENIPPERQAIPVESEDETWDEDITIEETPMEEYDDWRAYDEDLENEMKVYGKWDSSKDYSENILAYEDWQEGYHPFDKKWRRSKDKHIFDKDARTWDEETKARLGGIKQIREEQEQGLSKISKMEDIEGTRAYKVKHEKIEAERIETQKQADIDLGKGYHPDDEEWRRSKDKSLHMDMDEDGNPTDETPWRNEYQKKEISNISSDWENEDFWDDANGDGMIDNDELDTSKMSKEDKERWEKFNDADEKRFSKREKKHHKTI